MRLRPHTGGWVSWKGRLEAGGESAAEQVNASENLSAGNLVGVGAAWGRRIEGVGGELNGARFSSFPLIILAQRDNLRCTNRISVKSGFETLLHIRITYRILKFPVPKMVILYTLHHVLEWDSDIHR